MDDLDEVPRFIEPGNGLDEVLDLPIFVTRRFDNDESKAKVRQNMAEAMTANLVRNGETTASQKTQVRLNDG